MSDLLTNSMQAVVAVLPPPLKHITSFPIKDALLSSKKPFVNFGKSTQLITSNVSSSDKYKTAIAFTMPTIEDESWKGLKYVKLLHLS